jgi:diaminopimelate decarboxylase
MTEREQWERAILNAVGLVGTPCYVAAAAPIRENLEKLEKTLRGLPIRHFLSAKTQPVRALFELWNKWERDIEVVSEYELLAAIEVGFKPERILVNGVAKHSWLSKYQFPELRIHFDSLAEVERLAAHAAALSWHVGLRFNLPQTLEHDPDDPRFGTQFGMDVAEARRALSFLHSAGVSVLGIQCHIGTEIKSSELYELSVRWIVDQCSVLDFKPRYIDLGGGLPLAIHCTSDRFDLNAYKRSLSLAIELAPSIGEIWLENGRYISGTASVLVVSVVDQKKRGNATYLICDGGRTNHALVSDWEKHAVHVIPPRGGDLGLTTICGPTCMAFDHLGRFQLPALSEGDLIVWENAGAYHIPWETRFSHGTCPVVWCDEEWKASVCRLRESPREWWHQWL